MNEEQVRNQHKKMMNERPSGQRSLEECSENKFSDERELSENPFFQAHCHIDDDEDYDMDENTNTDPYYYDSEDYYE